LPTSFCYRWGDCNIDDDSSCEVEDTSLPTCTTTGGPSPNHPCIFPFHHCGVTYSSCTSAYLGKSWCSTATYPNGTHMKGQGKYGLCPPSCPGAEAVQPDCVPGSTWAEDCNTCVCSSTGTAVCTHEKCAGSCTAVAGPASGRECVFPFRWRGEVYRSCAPWTFGGPHQGKGGAPLSK
jgi:hypothetical protein